MFFFIITRSCHHKSSVWWLCYSCAPTSVPECAEFRPSFIFSWLRFKLHFAVPDLNVAVVLMRGTLAFSEPTRQIGGEKQPYKCDKLVYPLKPWKDWASPELRFCAVDQKDRCKSAMCGTCLSNTSHCCSFVCQPGKAEAFHRSLCRNPPSLKTHKRPWHTDQHRQQLGPQKLARANGQHVGTRRAASQTNVVHTTRSDTA